mmetsp:Transcript_28502/g.57368  ORF Transcript_28502/g.57368 Transcript_28502/m.57368 type:complete len:211 (+) Transcript_28502:418-1050(+)
MEKYRNKYVVNQSKRNIMSSWMGRSHKRRLSGYNLEWRFRYLQLIITNSVMMMVMREVVRVNQHWRHLHPPRHHILQCHAKHDFLIHPLLLLRIKRTKLLPKKKSRQTTNHQRQKRNQTRERDESLVVRAIDASRLVIRQKIALTIQSTFPIQIIATTTMITRSNLHYQQGSYHHPPPEMVITTSATLHPVPHHGYPLQLTRGRIVRSDE